MNHQLNFNIISEPSLLIDGITSDNINDGYYSYCIGYMNKTELYIIDPHQIDGSCIYTKPFSYLKNSFWMIYIPSE